MDITFERAELVRIERGCVRIIEQIAAGRITAQGAREALLKLVGAE